MGPYCPGAGLRAAAFALLIPCSWLPLAAEDAVLPVAEDGPPSVAPPPSPPFITAPAPAPVPTPLRAEPRLAGPTLYSIGSPTDDEQLYVEFINRARADPVAESERLATATEPNIVKAYGFFGVDLALMKSQFGVIAAAPPVSINALLTTAARGHTQDMIDHQFQGHVSTDGRDLGRRLGDVTYPFATAGENVYTNATGAWMGHAAYEVDWGYSTGGMQTPPGHRNTIHNAVFREVGVGVVNGVFGAVGPQTCTQDFATAQGAARAFVTGVAYYDVNGNQFYDLGEGLGGVKVTLAGVNTYAVTARSGGFSIPVSADGQYAARFELAGQEAVTRTVTVAGMANVKVDFTPAYLAPTFGGAPTAALGKTTPYTCTSVNGASGYEAMVSRLLPWSRVEGAESGLGGLTADISEGYSAVATDVALAGHAAFHLAQPQPARNQYLTLAKPVKIGPAGALTFASRLGWAMAGQSARVQISTDDGVEWRDLWWQAGSGGAGEAAFTRHTLPLTDYSGRVVRLRFAYVYESGKYYPQSSTGVGLYLDEISLADAREPVDTTVRTMADAVYHFVPDAVGIYQFQARALVGDRVFPWGPAFVVTATEAGPVDPARVRIGSFTAREGGGFLLRFVLEQGDAAAFAVESAAALEGPWAELTDAVVQSTPVAGEYQAGVSGSGDARRFYRVVVK